ncbi:MAG: RluA family pseudouridine synthase [Flavobacteriales bacterium]|nr:RluA family pseudouridine synthase [Flavobacteriales bacterium]
MNQGAPLAHFTAANFSKELRLQDALPSLAGDWIASKKGCKKAIERERVLLNDVVGRTGDWVHNGDRITLLQAKQIQIVKIPVPLHIGFEDDAILVVWKPAGLHTSGNHQTSLRSQVATWAKIGTLADSLGHPEPAHRLDFATSGWIVFGRTSKALQELNVDFKNERIKKHYLAIVHGKSPAELKIHLPLENKSAYTATLCWATGNIPTRGEGSLICVATGSGRTHQIRKHLYAIQHGIVGDDRYGNGAHYAGHGLLLCAYRLEFTHPITHQLVKVEASPPRKFKRFSWVKEALATVELQPLP